MYGRGLELEPDGIEGDGSASSYNQSGSVFLVWKFDSLPASHPTWINPLCQIRKGQNDRRGQLETATQGPSTTGGCDEEDLPMGKEKRRERYCKLRVARALTTSDVHAWHRRGTVAVYSTSDSQLHLSFQRF